MSGNFSRTNVCWSIVACLVVTTSATTATAQNKAIGIGLGVGAGLLLLNEAAKAMQNPQQQRQQRPQGQRQSSGESSGERAAPKKTAEQKALEAKAYFAALEELQERNRSTRQEAERDFDGAISDFIKDLKRRLEDKKKSGSAVTVSNDINQVTEGEVKRLIEAAFDGSRLPQFERMPGEMWTRNRLLVRMLRQSKRELASYVEGVGVRGTSKDDLRNIFEKAAAVVQYQAIETAEIVGVSYSFDRFIRTIFENSDQVPDSLSTQGADGHYERIVSQTIDSIPREVFIAAQNEQSIASDPLGLQRHFLYRFRARRAVYDCISSSYMKIVRGDTGAGSAGQMIDAGLKAGAQSDTTQAATSASPAQGDARLQATGATLQELPVTWQRMHQYAGSACRTVLADVATQARDNRLDPKPARWDSTLGDGQWKPILPAGGYGVPTLKQ